MVGFCLNFGLYGLLFVLSLFFQGACRYSAVTAGLAFLPLTATIAAMLLLSGRIAIRFGSPRPMIVGMALATLGCLLLLSLGGWNGYSGAVVAGFILVGMGIGMTMPAMTAVALASAPPQQSGIASGVLSRQPAGRRRRRSRPARLGRRGAGTGPGLRLDLAITAGAFLLSCVVSSAWIGRRLASIQALPCRVAADRNCG